MPSPSLFDRLPDELVDRIFSYVWQSFRAVPTDADPYNDEPDAVPLHYILLDKRTFRFARPGLWYLAAGRHGENEKEMLRRLPSRDEHWAEIDEARVDLVSEWAPAALKRICACATPLTRLVISGGTFELPAKMLVDALRPVERTLRSLTVYAEPAYAEWESPIEYALCDLAALDTFETSSSRWARELIENGVDELRALSVDDPKPDGVFDDLLWDKVEHLRLSADGELACGSDLIVRAFEYLKSPVVVCRFASHCRPCHVSADAFPACRQTRSRPTSAASRSISGSLTATRATTTTPSQTDSAWRRWSYC